jgi:indolepyruvate decarboxylase
MKIGAFLLRRIEDAGVRHLSGVPGLLQTLRDTAALHWIGACNELTASYAAAGYARLKGIGALLVTNGVGAPGPINGIGGSHGERVPVICIAGSLPLRSIEGGLGMHHTKADGSFDQHQQGGRTRLRPTQTLATRELQLRPATSPA